MESPGIQIDVRKKHQEMIAKFAFPFFLVFTKLYRFIYRGFRLQGVFYGLNRAKQRARVKHLGEYSDISPGVIIKYPENFTMGVRSCIGSVSFIDAGGGVFIGDFVMISHMVSINSMSHSSKPPYHRTIKAATRINNQAWIGAGSIIREGVEIGEGAIVGAGSVVTKDVPPWTIVAGVPAKYLRHVLPDSENKS